MMPKKQKELKFLDLNIKSVDDEGYIEGYGSTFGNVDAYGDIIDKNAFNRTLKSNRRVIMLFNHRGNQVIGKWETLSKTQHGLKAKGQLNLDIPLGKEVHSHLKHDDFNGLSIGFSIEKSEWDDENKVRIIKEVKLYEISVTPFPANEEATISRVKSENLDLFEDLDFMQQNQVLGFIKSLHPDPVTTDDSEPKDQDDQTKDAVDDEDDTDGTDIKTSCHSDDGLDTDNADSELLDSVKQLVADLKKKRKDSQDKELLHSTQELIKQLKQSGEK